MLGVLKILRGTDLYSTAPSLTWDGERVQIYSASDPTAGNSDLTGGPDPRGGHKPGQQSAHPLQCLTGVRPARQGQPRG